MKKWFAMLLIAAMVTSLFACKAPTESESEQTKATETEQTETQDTQDEETTGTSTDTGLLNPEDPIAALMALCEEYHGFELMIGYVDGRVIQLGGKDNSYWFKQTEADATFTLSQAKYEDGTWTDVVYAMEDGLYKAADLNGGLTIQLAAAQAYAFQPLAAEGTVTPDNIRLQGVECTTFDLMGGLMQLMVAKEYGVTVDHSIKDNDTDSFTLIHIKTGDEVEAPETPEVSGEADIDSPEYWDSIYGVSICPFSIKTEEEKEYVFRGGGDLYDWLRTELNTDGWYQLGDKVISKDGKWVIEEPESFSSYCTFEAAPYSGETLTEEEQAEIKKGDVYAIHSWTPFYANHNGHGLVFLNQMEEGAEPTLSGLPKEFHAGEEIRVAKADYDADFEGTMKEKCKLYVFPHRDFAEYKAALTEDMLAEAIASSDYALCESDVSEIEQPRFTLTIPEDQAAGEIDFVFVFDNAVAYVLAADIVE